MATWLYTILVVCFGLIIGSFLNVVIHRGPVMWGLAESSSHRHGSLTAPRSYCPNCGQALTFANLVPIFSYLVQKGECSACGVRISPRYPLIELAGGIAALVAYALHGSSIEALLLAVFFWMLIPLAAIDFELGFLPDMLTLPLIALGIGFNTTGKFTPLIDATIGATLGYAVFRLIAEIFKRLRNKDGLGQGDAKLLAAIGAWGGWIALAPTVFIAALASLITICISSIFGYKIKRDSEIAFGPALAIAGALAVAAISRGYTPDRLITNLTIGL